MRKLLFILLIPIIAYGATYGYLWYETRNQAESVRQAAAPFARLGYDSIYISPQGNEVGLNNITIQPLMTQDRFVIERLRITAPHVGHFLKISSGLKPGELPENMRLQLGGVHIDMDSELFTMLEQMQAQMAAAQPNAMSDYLLSPDAPGCGDRSGFTLSDYQEMGQGKMVADISAEAWYNAQLNQTVFKVNADFRQLYDIDLTLSLDGRASGIAANITPTALPDIQLRYRDKGYYKLRNNYCASQSNGSVDEYVERNIELLSNLLGARLPKEGVSAYRKLMHNGGTVSLRLKPSSELPLEGLEYYKTSDIIDMLGLTVRIDNTPVELEKVIWLETPPVSKARQSEARKKPDAGEKSAAPPPRELITRRSPTTRSSPSFHTISVAAAPKYLNRLAEVTTTDGRVREGKLQAADDMQLTLVMNVRAGSLSYPVAIRDIDRLRVRY